MHSKKSADRTTNFLGNFGAQRQHKLVHLRNVSPTLAVQISHTWPPSSRTAGWQLLANRDPISQTRLPPASRPTISR